MAKATRKGVSSAAAGDPMAAALLALARVQGEFLGIDTELSRRAAAVLDGLLAAMTSGDDDTVEALKKAALALQLGEQLAARTRAIKAIREAVQRELAGETKKPGGKRPDPKNAPKDAARNAESIAWVVEFARVSNGAEDLFPMDGTAELRVEAWTPTIRRAIKNSEDPDSHAENAKRIVSACMKQSGFERPSRVDDPARARDRHKK